MKSQSFIFYFCLFFIGVPSAIGAQDTTSVLFIGNSFTFMYKMPDMFKDIAASYGKNVFVQKSVKEGMGWQYHASTRATYDAINSRKWDVVIIQEQSNMPAQPQSVIDKSSIPYARQLVDSIRKNSECTRIFLYMTWAYRDGNPHWSEIGNYAAMQKRVNETYMRYADIFNLQIAPIGAVWSYVRNSYPGLNLYHKDNHHSSHLGSYLVACTFYTSIFGKSAYGCKFLDGEDKFSAEIVQLAVAQVVLNNLQGWRISYEEKPLRPAFDIIVKGNKIELFDRSDNAYSVNWEFSDGSKSSETNPEHRFKKNGTYTIRQIVKDKCQTKELERKVSID
jgi:hypothetical protein